MKLAALLAQYLYQQKKLDLAGIGSFLFDPSVQADPDPQHNSEGISFEYNTNVNDDQNLIEFISTQTGKMKALATSDLHSYVQLAREFLNIGRPFQIEGIGTLVKNKNNELQFTADHLLLDKVKEGRIKELSATSISDESLTTYETLKPHAEKSPGYKKVFLTLLAICTVAAILWIGYKTYKKNSPAVVSHEQQEMETAPVNDTAKYIPPVRDTAVAVQAVQKTTTDGNYRFVIEVANKRRAFYRYSMLKKGQIPVRISTKDSLSFKLFFVLPATAADTARISDSLTIWYPAMNHKRAFAEQ